MSRNLIRALLLGCVLSTLLVQSIACNTVKGAGRDVEQAGEGVQNAADSASRH